MKKQHSVRPQVEALEERLVPAAVGTPTQNFVDQLYRDLLHRVGDQNGVFTLAGAIDAGQVTRQQAILALENSPEGEADLVIDVYGRFLQRTPDQAGLAFWTNYLARGNSTVALEAQLLGSAEYQQLHTGPINGFMNALFNDVLCRNVDDLSAASFNQALALGVTPQQVALEVLTSQEGRQHQVLGYYTSYLRRSADAAGLAFWTGVLQQGATTASPPGVAQDADAVMVASLLSTNEYFSNAQTQTGFASVPTCM